MKTSAALLAAAAGLAMAKPAFTNSNFDIVAGEEFTLTFKGCSSGCTIDLLKGDPKNLDVVQTIVSDTKAEEFPFRMSSKFPTDKYAFRITAEDDPTDPNYSERFDFEGAAPEPTTSVESTTAAETTTSAEETSTEETSTEETTMMTTTSETETMSTPESSSTESEAPTTTDSENSEQTSEDSDSDNQDGAAVRLGSSHVTLAAAAVAVFGYFL